MKVLKALLAILVMGVLLASLIGCTAKTSSATASTQIYTVKRGDLSQDITAAGNLALSVTQDLPISLFYQGTNGRGGTVGQVLVQVGDAVKKGQVLVTVDQTEWADQLSNLQDNVSTAQRNVTNKSISETDAQRQLAAYQRAVTTAQRAVASAQRTVETKKIAVTSAELTVQSANSTLNSIADVKVAKDAIDEIKLKLRLAGMGDSSYWVTQRDNLLVSLSQAQQAYNDLISGTTITTSTDVDLLIAQRAYALNKAQSDLLDAQTAVDDAMKAVDTAQQAVDDANYNVTKQQQAVVNAQADVDTANNNLGDAQKKLSDAQAMNPEIKAPFDGFVTALNVKAGQAVNNGTIAATVADPTKFEADILVSEMDIMKISVGGEATMTLNALPTVSLPAVVTQISPTASISSGVVNYSVTVNITGLPSFSAGSAPAATGNTTGGFTPRSSWGTTGGGSWSGRGSGQAGSSQVSSAAVQNFQLKQGLTGTVDLVVAQRNNVLLVPNTAITKAGGQSTVQVMTGNNTIEKRTVEIGLADWQNTEITGGLSEGENIIVPKNIAPTSTASTSQQRVPGIQFLGR